MKEPIIEQGWRRYLRAAATLGAIAMIGVVALAGALPTADVGGASVAARAAAAAPDPGLVGSARAAAGGSDRSPVEVVAQHTGCSERALFVRWTLRNAGPRPRTAVLRAALRAFEGAPVVATSQPEQVQLGAGETRAVTFKLPREGGAEGMRLILGVQAGEGRFEQIHAADARFPCLRDCPAAHVVVRRGSVSSEDDDVVCPRRGDWVGSIAVQDKQSAYCSYSWQASDASEPDLDRFDDLDAGDWEKDCLSIGAQAGLSMEELVTTTDARLGIDDRSAIASDPALDYAPELYPVRLAVVDTAGNAYERTDVDDNSDHGRVVGIVARRTACADAEDGACPIRIDNRPALRIVYDSASDERTYEVDPVNGGYIGSQGQIARAINSTLRDWDPEREHLVINLSLGWHEKFSCAQPGCGLPLHVDMESRMLVPNGTPTGYTDSDGDDEGFGLGTRAVLVAIARARCLGALVFAAVGNAVAENNRGPLMPAAWNGLDASKLDCSNAFDGRASGGRPTGGLVKAVAAVDFEGRRAALSRIGTLPFLVAHGVGVSVRDSRPRATLNGGFTGPLSGSSLATAAVSGAAAMAWSLAGPNATAEQVFQALYEAGTPIAPDRGRATSPDSDLCGRGAHDRCRTPMEVDACAPLRAFQNTGAARPGMTSAKRAALAAAVAQCSGERVLPRSSEPTTDPQISVALDAEGGYVAQLDVESQSGEPAPFNPDGLVDMYEAPFSQPQPGPIKCATCALYRGTNLAQYRLDFNTAFSEDGSAITGAFVHILSGDYEPIPLSSRLLSGGELKGRVDLTTFDVGDSQVRLIVNFEETDEGIPVSATELIDTLLDP